MEISQRKKKKNEDKHRNMGTASDIVSLQHSLFKLILSSTHCCTLKTENRYIEINK